jgi:hypothetical protein
MAEKLRFYRGCLYLLLFYSIERKLSLCYFLSLLFVYMGSFSLFFFFFFLFFESIYILEACRKSARL